MDEPRIVLGMVEARSVNVKKTTNNKQQQHSKLTIKISTRVKGVRGVKGGCYAAALGGERKALEVPQPAPAGKSYTISHPSRGPEWHGFLLTLHKKKHARVTFATSWSCAGLFCHAKDVTALNWFWRSRAHDPRFILPPARAVGKADVCVASCILVNGILFIVSALWPMCLEVLYLFHLLQRSRFA